MLRAPSSSKRRLLRASTIFNAFRTVPAQPPSLQSLALSQIKQQAVQDPSFRPEALLPCIFHKQFGITGVHWRETIAKEEILSRFSRCQRNWRVREALAMLEGVGPSGDTVPIELDSCPFTHGNVTVSQDWVKRSLIGETVIFFVLERRTLFPAQVRLIFLQPSPDETATAALIHCEMGGRVSAGTAVSSLRLGEGHFISDAPLNLLSDLPVFRLFTRNLEPPKDNTIAIKRNRGPPRSDAFMRTYQEIIKRPTGELKVRQSTHNFSIALGLVSELELERDVLTVKGRVALQFEDEVLEIMDRRIGLETGQMKILEDCLVDNIPLPENMKTIFC